MRKDDDVELVAGSRGPVEHANGIFQLGDAEELDRGEGADGDDELGSKDRHLAVEMFPAVRDFDGIRHTIATLGILSRKASDHRADVNPLTELFLGEPRRL